MTNEETKKAEKELNALLNMCNPSPLTKELEDALKIAIKALEQQQDVHDTCIEDYPTCTECEHYDSEKHYCPRFCQVIKYTLAEAQPTEMRDATEEERKSVKDYVESISKPTGFNFYEAQPSEDTEVIKVSKGAVKARQGRFVIYDVEWLKENFYTTEEKIYGQPKQPCEDAVSRQAVINTIFYKSDNSCDVVLSTDLMDRIKQLPSVTPQRQKGKWIFREDMGHQYCCSECGCPKPSVNDYYYKKIIGCPYCLADMSGGGEDENNS